MRRKVIFIYPDDVVVVDDLDNVFERAIDSNPILIGSLVGKYGLEKAKRIVGFMMELGNFFIEKSGKTVVSLDLVIELAKQWEVSDLIKDELINLFLSKFGVEVYET